MVIHHTADNEHAEQAVNVQDSHTKKGYPKSSLGSNICYHFLVGKDGTVKQNRSLYERAGCTRNTVANSAAIQIVVAGNFDIEKPTTIQLDSLRSLVKRLDNTFHFEEIVGHKDESPTACPGKHLDAAIADILRKKDKSEVWYITRYYSPEEGQKKYFHGSYLKDVEINCGLNKDGTAGDCVTTANGHKLEGHQAFQVAACPPEIAFGTKIDIEGIGIVTCHDRGGAIKEKRLDVWAGFGMEALMRLKTKPGGYLRVTFLNK